MRNIFNRMAVTLLSFGFCALWGMAQNTIPERLNPEQSENEKLTNVVSTLYKAETSGDFMLTDLEYIEYLNYAIQLLDEMDLDYKSSYSYGKFITQICYNHINEIIYKDKLYKSDVYNIIRYIFEYNYPDCIVTRICRNDIKADYLIYKAHEVVTSDHPEYSSYLYFAAIRHKFRGEYYNYVTILEKIIDFVNDGDALNTNIGLMTDLAEVYYLLGFYNRVIEILTPLNIAEHSSELMDCAKAARYLSLSFGELGREEDALRAARTYCEILGKNRTFFDEEEMAIANALVCEYSGPMTSLESHHAIIRNYLKTFENEDLSFEENLNINYWNSIEHNIFPNGMIAYLMGMEEEPEMISGDFLYAASKYAAIEPLIKYLNNRYLGDGTIVPYSVILCYSKIGNLDKASEICISNINLCSGEDKEMYFRILLDLANDYVKQGNPESAYSLVSPNQPYMSLLDSMDFSAHLEAVNNLALIDMDCGNVKMALQKLEYVYDQMRLNGELTPEREYKIISNIALANSYMGKYSEAKRKIDNLMAFAECDDSISPEEMVRLYNVAAIIYGDMGQPELQKNYHKIAFNLQNISMTDKIDLGFELANDYMTLGDTIVGKNYYIEAINEFIQSQHVDSQQLFIDQLYGAKQFLGVNDAKTIYSQIISSAFLSVLSQKQQKDILLLYSDCLIECRQYDDALAILNNLENNYDLANEYRDKFYELLSDIYRGKDEYELAVNCSLKRLENDFLDPMNPNNALIDVYNKLSLDYLSIDAEISEEWVTKAINAKMVYIDRQFAKLNYESKTSLWAIYHNSFFGLPSYLSDFKYGSKLLYDIALFRKGILLSSEQRMHKAITCSNDTVLRTMYTDYRNSLNLKAKLSLVERLKLEGIIYNQITQIDGITTPLSVKWQSVKENLKDGEIAIEFIYMLSLESNQMEFFAMTLKSDYTEPHIIKLPNSHSVIQIDRSDLYETDSVYNLIWRPLMAELYGVKNVYLGIGV